ncbi:MarR family winged helix-turn-helix transcriptional regulator [Streptosporangium saharense]|uniref:DNA-binding MarR family transcriptional regulator n=1 Tax=Streptosporangium saharense TaxID=1706840 RepID=A0A7W7QRP7_9ACTN|nr:MarR family winged helix-turn-helix transcriptional regulator [Streptosporangium saharense]MBB4918368.1 DNA-binding MarR family transcriptional regulator [Streptosporangium saharense]
MVTTGLGSSLAYLLSRAERSVNRGLAAALTAEDVSVEQWRILRALADDCGHSMGDLAETVLMPHPTLTKAIDRLIDRAFVYRGHDPADRRRVAVFLADRGAELLARVEGAIAEHHREIEAAYGTERTEQLMGELERLVKALNEGPAERPPTERLAGPPGRLAERFAERDGTAVPALRS